MIERFKAFVRQKNTEPMFIALARERGTQEWHLVTNFSDPFAANESVIDVLIEKKAAKHPELEYKKERA